MRSRNYQNEIGVNASDRPVPVAVAFVILAVVAVVAFFLVRQVLAQPAAHADAVPAKVGAP